MMGNSEHRSAGEAATREQMEGLACGGPQLVEILSWRLITELWRRYPRRFDLIEMHPGGGQYDCLGLLSKETSELAIDVNRGGGSVHVHKHAFGLTGEMAMYSDWVQRMLGPSPGRFLDVIADEARLPVQKKLPASTPTTLTDRYISDFRTHSLGRLDRWECRNGFEDTSGYVGGIRHQFFELFPMLAEGAARRLGKPIMGEHAYNFWFLVRDEKPMLCLDTSGTLYRRDGASHDLSKLYHRDRRIWPILCATAIDILP